MASKKAKVEPVAFVARDYVVLADGRRFERGDKLPADVARLLPDSFKETR